MRILVVAPEYPPNVIGGGGAVYQRLTKYLHQRENDVTTLFGDFTNRTWLAGLSVQELVGEGRLAAAPLIPTPRRFPWLTSAMPPTPRAALEIWRFIRRESLDVAHLHGVGFPLIDLCAQILQRQGIPYLLTVHGVPTSPFERGFLPRVATQLYLNASTIRTVKRAAKVSLVSNALLDNPYISLDGMVIHNGIDDVAESAREGRSIDELRLISVSRLSRNKGIDVSIKAVASLAKRLRVKYDIYGPDGGEERQLRALVEELDAHAYIKFCGTFAPEERADLFSRYDALLLPSRTEAFGLAALEAMAFGLPVVARNVDGLQDWVTPGAAVLVDTDDTDVWAVAIERLTIRERWLELSVQGLKLARKFKWTNLLATYERILVSIARTKATVHVGSNQYVNNSD